MAATYDIRVVPDAPLHHVPRWEELQELMSALLREAGPKKLCITAPAGAGDEALAGMGKTTLAAALARRPEIAKRFSHGVFWVSVGRNPKLTYLQAALASAIGHSVVFDSPGQGHYLLEELFADKAVLLVLDDVWSAEHASKLAVVGKKGRFLVTARHRGVAAALAAEEIGLGGLAPGAAAELLCKWAGREVPGGRGSVTDPDLAQVVNACGGVPLALVMTGAMARARGLGWAEVAGELARIEPAELAERYGRGPDLAALRALDVSVFALDGPLRQRYLDLAVFASSRSVSQSTLASLWQVSREEALRDMDALVDRGLVVRTPNGIALHELQRLYVRSQGADKVARHQGLVAAYKARCDRGLVHGPTDSPADEARDFYARLPYHLAKGGQVRELVELFADYRWLDAKIEAVGVADLLADFDYVSGAGELGLVRDALLLAGKALVTDRRQLPSQLVGRLGRLPVAPGGCIATLLTQAGEQARYPWLCPQKANLTPPGGPLINTLSGHTDAVNAVAVTGDGSRAVSASSDHTLAVWDVVDGALLHTLTGHKDWVDCVAVTADGARAVSSSTDGTVRVWDLESGRQVAVLTGHSGVVTAVTVTADGTRIITTAWDMHLKIWDAASGAELGTLVGHEGIVAAVAVTPDKRRVVSASWDKTLRVWDVDTCRVEHVLTGHTGYVMSVAITQDGAWAVSASSDKTLKVWDLATGALVCTLEGHTSGVMDVDLLAWRGSYVAVSAASDKTLKLWDLHARRELYTLSGHAGGVTTVATGVQKDGRPLVVSGSWDRTIKLWDMERCVEPVGVDGHGGGITAVAVAAAGAGAGAVAVSAADDGTLKIWDGASGDDLATLHGHTEYVTAVAVTADGTRAVSGSWDQTVRLWDLASRRELAVLRGHTGWVRALALIERPGERPGEPRLAVSGSSDKTLKIWDLDARREVCTLAGHEGGITTVAVTPDGRRIISAAADETLKVWDVDSRREVYTLRGHDGFIFALAVTADGKQLITACDDESIKVWDLATGTERYTLYGHTVGAGLTAVAVTGTGPDGRALVISASWDETLKVWDLATGTEVRTLSDHDGGIRAVAVTRDGKKAVSAATDHTLKVWDLATGAVVATFTGDGDMITCALIPGSDVIAAGDQLGRMHFLRLMEPRG